MTKDFLLAFGASENTITYSVSYMNIYSLGTIFVQLTLGMNAFITAQEFAKTGMLSVLIGAVTNIVLDPILIFGFNMGVKGAALATILSQALSCALVLPLQGLGQGAQPIISYNYGARNVSRVNKAFQLLLKTSLCYSSLLWLGIMIFLKGFASIFTSDAALLDFTSTALGIYLAAILLFSIQMACQMTFTSLGNAKASILVAVMRKFILLVPLIYIMPKILRSDRIMAVYMEEPIADFIAVAFTALLFFFQFHKTLGEIS